MSGDEHPSGLRDAIERVVSDYLGEDEGEYVREMMADLYRELVAWLSHIGEGEREAAARAHFATRQDDQIIPIPWEALPAFLRDVQRERMSAALAASRGVLLAKETR